MAGVATLCHPNQKRLIIFAGRSNPDLGSKIAELLGVRLGEVILKTFANGENYCRYASPPSLRCRSRRRRPYPSMFS